MSGLEKVIQRLQAQKRNSKNKLYSFHAPEVEAGLRLPAVGGNFADTLSLERQGSGQQLVLLTINVRR